MKIGDKITLALSEKGWSATRLAKAVSVTPATISRILAGGDTSSIFASKIAKILGESLDWLCDETRGVDTRARPASTPLETIPDFEIVQLLNSRVRRIVEATGGDIGALREFPAAQVPKSGPADYSPEQRLRFMTAVARTGQTRNTLFHLTFCYAQLTEAASAVAAEIDRILGISTVWPTAEDADTARKVLARLTLLFDSNETPYPWDYSPNKHNPTTTPGKPKPKRRGK
jgi:transcriptional regulator with XRE-family HTH domain